MRFDRLLLSLASVSALLAACPDPTELGHKPKQQVDKAQQAVDQAEKAMQQRVNKAVKAGESTGNPQ
jgi:outer membrane biogenesis lipoprotein LolB